LLDGEKCSWKECSRKQERIGFYKTDSSLEKEEAYVEIWSAISESKYFILAVKETAP